MVTATITVAPLGTSLKSLVNGFVLTKQTEGKSPRTVEFYSETSKQKASHTTVRHYFVVLANFFGWVVREGFLPESPTARIKVAKPKAKVIKPYTYEEIIRMLAVCDNDYEHNAKFLGNIPVNRAINE